MTLSCSTRDPFIHLPLEIASEIFTHCIPPYGADYARPSYPLLLLNICSFWTQIALATPKLWANLYLRIPAPVMITPDFIHHLTRWLARSQSFPLLLFLCPKENKAKQGPHPEIIQLITVHAHHLRELRLRCCSYLVVFSGSPSSPPLHFPILKALVAKHLRRDQKVILTSDEFVDILLGAPSLSILDVHMISIISSSPSDEHGPVVHAALTSLAIREDIYRSDSDSPSHNNILSLLTLPCLTRLSFQINRTDDIACLTSFLQRSSSPLKKLELTSAYHNMAYDSNYHWNPNAIERCFTLLPTLIALEMCGPLTAMQDVLISLLVGNESTFLPDLAEFKIVRAFREEAGWFVGVASMLQGRVGRMKHFSVLWSGHGLGPVSTPLDAQWEAFRVLEGRGMRIELNLG
ncbi:hypothetical protein R3P38DRAFT_597114 [Favolaschia claudopus]|uniref:F-box domain-containing protein n=1 Tax=Favolaschia claudopus TaxID=2862362 RepID=A0AAV9Z8R0_9AGAR